MGILYRDASKKQRFYLSGEWTVEGRLVELIQILNGYM